MKRIKAWLCAHGVHQYMLPGHWHSRVCTWCGHIDHDADFFSGGPRPA